MSKSKNRKNLTRVEKLIIAAVSLGIFAIATFVIVGQSSTSSPVSTILNTITLNAGAVDNASHDIDIAVVRFAQSVRRTGVATTTLLPDGNILSNTITSQGNFDIVLQDPALPHLIHFFGVTYRQVPNSSKGTGNILDGPPKEIWSLDMTNYALQVSQDFNSANPGALLLDYRDLLHVRSVKVAKDGSEMIALSAKEISIPKLLTKKYGINISGESASSLIYFYVSLSQSKDINRVLVVPSSNKITMMSYDGIAIKSVDKPDLTLVLPSTAKNKAKK